MLNNFSRNYKKPIFKIALEKPIVKAQNYVQVAFNRSYTKT